MYSLTMVMMMLKSSCLTVVWNYTHHLLVSHDDDDDDDGDFVFNGLLHIAYSSFLRQEDADDRFWNYTERRAETPTLCTFYNSDFLIYSSMGSFYIPCVIMICLYSRIFFAIRAHARKAAAAAAKKKAVGGTPATKTMDANDKSQAAGKNKPKTVSERTETEACVLGSIIKTFL